jgi:tetratricopeptide (TPR) repeat protein
MRNSLSSDEILVLDKALCYLLYDEIDRSILELIKVPEDLKNNEIYFLLLATAYEYSNQLDLAYNSFDRVHVYDSTKVEPYLKKGLIHYIKGNNQDALKQLNKMISLDTGSVSGYSYRALVYASLGQFNEAINDYNTFLKADSTQSNIYYGRGYCKERLADYDGAHNDYLIALSKRNTLSNSLYNNIMNGEARIALSKKDTVFALEIVDEIINNDNDNDEARVIKSNILISREEYDEALSQLNKAINFGAVTVKLVMMRAKLLTRMESFEKSIVDLNAIIEVQPENAEALFYRAVAYAKTDDEDKARTDLEKSKSLNFDTKSWSLPFDKPQLFVAEENKE